MTSTADISCPVDWIDKTLAEFPTLPRWVVLALDLARVSPPATPRCMDLEDLERELETETHLGWSGDVNFLKEIDLEVWMCTDTMVGLRALLFRDRAVGLSYQQARKSDTTYIWFSREDALAVRQALRDLDEQRKDVHIPVASDDPPLGEWTHVKQVLLGEHEADPAVELDADADPDVSAAS